MDESIWFMEETYPLAMLEACKLTDRQVRLFAVACCKSVWHLWDKPASRHAVEVSCAYADGLATINELRLANREADIAIAIYDPDETRASVWIAEPDLKKNGRAIEGVVAYAGDANLQGRIIRDIAGNPFCPLYLLGNPGRGHRFYTVSKTQTESNCIYRSRRFLVDDTILEIARTAYNEHPKTYCSNCRGRGFFFTDAMYATRGEKVSCNWCIGTGILDDGTLDSSCLSILADALEDAGCDCQEVIEHLRAVCPFCKDANFANGDHAGAMHPALSRHVQRSCVCKGTRRMAHYRGCWVVDAILEKNQ